MRRRYLFAITLLLAAGAAVWWEAGRKSAPPSPPNILLITLDTTRADHIGAYGYPPARTPTLDRLAREGVLFEHARTAAPTTLPAHVSLLTGRYPAGHGVRNNGVPLSETVPTLAAALHNGGYRTAAFVSSFVLDRRFGLAPGFDHYDDRLDPGPGSAAEPVERRGDRTVAAAGQWLDEYRASRSGSAASATPAAPFFLWLHLYDPHDPYVPPEPFRDSFADHPYDGEIAFTDSVVGSFIKRLEGLGLLPTTLVAVIGDHGESLGDHGEATHGMFVYEAAMRIPVILRWPALLPAGSRVTPMVRSIDLAPTLIELAGLPVLAGLDGSSLMPLVRGSAPGPGSAYGETYFPLLFMNWSPLRSLQDERWKFIEAPEPELYDLASDPSEKTNLSVREPARTSAMRRALTAMTTARTAAPGAMPSRETVEKLAALGYVGAPSAMSSAEALKRPDPKKMIDVFNRLRLANSAFVEGRLGEAAGIANETLAVDRENAFAMLIVARVAMAQGRYRDAASHFQGYLSQVPISADAHQWLAICHFQLGDERAALREVDAALAIDSRFGDARELRGNLLFLAGQPDESLRELRTAVELNPDRSAFRASLGRALLNTGHPDQAETELRRALALRPDRYEVRLDLARTLEALGRRPEARAEYDALLSGPGVAAEVKIAARERLGHLGK